MSIDRDLGSMSEVCEFRVYRVRGFRVVYRVSHSGDM